MNELNKDRIYRASIYLRLSREDGDKAESDSIKNQRDLIHYYLRDKPDIEVVSERVDDGYSGVNFDRPAVKELIADAESGAIDCIIVKDLSRLGRNFIEVGTYLDRIFPKLGVRVISIGENFDSVNGRTQSDNILLPFLNLINDAHLRDTSVKIRSQRKVRVTKGDFVGPFAVYGYMKDPNNKHQLIVDDYAAEIVSDIFKWKLEGMTQQGIADRLNKLGVLSPIEYKRTQGINLNTSFVKNSKCYWSSVSVRRVLENEDYTGTLVQGKTTSPNHKIKKRSKLPEDQWVRVENRHEAIISKEDYLIVKKLLLADTRSAPGKKSMYPLSGITFCADCGAQMIRTSVKKNGKTYYYYMCGNNRTTKECTSHRIPDKELTDGVLETLKAHISTVIGLEDILKNLNSIPIRQKDIAKFNNGINVAKLEVARYDGLKKALLENFKNGVLEKTEYHRLKKIYDEKEENALSRLKNLEAELASLIAGTSKPEVWINKFKEHQNITALERKLVVTLIDRIECHNDKRIEIFFYYKQNFDLAMSYIKAIKNAHQDEYMEVADNGKSK